MGGSESSVKRSRVRARGNSALWLALVWAASAACLPPIPEVGRGCNTDDDCSKGYFSLVSSNIYCVEDDDIPDSGVCLALPQRPDSDSDAGPLDAGPPDGGIDDAGVSDAGLPDRNDPYACEGYTPLVRGVVVARQDGATVRQPLEAFDLAAPLTGWTVRSQTSLGLAEVRGADIAFEPALGASGVGTLILSTEEANTLPCADRLIAVRVHVIDGVKYKPLDPEAPDACPDGQCGRVLLTEAQPVLLAGATYDSIAVVSGVAEIAVMGAAPGEPTFVQTLSYFGAPLSVAGLDELRLAEPPIGETAQLTGHTPALHVDGGERLVVDGWLRTERLVLSAAGAAAPAEVLVGGAGWLQSDARLTVNGPTALDVSGVLAVPAGASLDAATLQVDGALVAGGVVSCQSASATFGPQGQIWAVNTALLDCSDVELPDVWVTHDARLRLGTRQARTRFRAGARLSSRGHIDVCRWEDVGAQAPPLLTLDDDASLTVGAPVVDGQHDALLSACTVVGDDVETEPEGACGTPPSFSAPAALGTRGVLVGCVGAAPCPTTSRLAESDLIDAPAGPYHPMFTEVAGGELISDGMDLTFTRGFVAQRSTAEVLSCTGPSFDLLIDTVGADASTWFWRSDATDDDFTAPANWIDIDGLPAVAAPPAAASTRLMILPGEIGPRLLTGREAGDLSVFSGAELALAAPLRLAGAARVSGRVVAAQASGQLVLSGQDVDDAALQVAGNIDRLVFEQESEPRLASALNVDHLLLRSPDGALTFGLREGAHVVVQERFGVEANGVEVALEGPSDGAPSLIVRGTLDLGPIASFTMTDGAEIEVHGGFICDNGAPAAASFAATNRLRFVGTALQPLSCKSSVGALPPLVTVDRRARVQLDGAEVDGVGVTRVASAAPDGSTLFVDGELLFFGPDQTPQQLEGVDEVIVGPGGVLRFPADDTGLDLLGGATCAAAEGSFAPGQLEGFDAWCAP